MNLDKFTNLLLEGGKAVGEVSRVSRENVDPTLKAFNKKVLSKIGITNFRKIGSTGKKSSSGDLDVAVELPEDLDYKEVHSQIQQMGYEVTKASPTTISVKFPIYDSEGKTNEWAQVDLMFGKADWLEFGYYAPGEGESKYTGAHRNFLLAAIIRYARELKGKEGKTWAIDLNRGLNRKTRGTKTTKTGKEKEVTLAKTLITQRPEKVVELLNMTTGTDWKLSDLKAPFEHLWQKTKEAFPEDVLDKIRVYVGNASRVQKKEEPVMEQLIRKLSKEVLNEEVLNKELLLEDKKRTPASNLHEISFGIFVSDISADIKSKDDLLEKANRFFKNDSLPAKNKISKINDDILLDAKNLAIKFNEKFKNGRTVDKVLWAGDNSDYNPADVIVYFTDGSEEYISLKKGEAQISSLTIGPIVDKIKGVAESVEKNFLKRIYKNPESKKDLDNLTSKFFRLLREYYPSPSKYDEIFDRIKNSTNKWEEWEKIKSEKEIFQTKKEIQDFVKPIGTGNREWKNIRNRLLYKIMDREFKNILESSSFEEEIEEVIKSRLNKIFKEAVRIGDNDYDFILLSSDYAVRFPSSKKFDEKISENIDIKYSFTGLNDESENQPEYGMSIKAFDLDDNLLINFKLRVRFHTGQMVNPPVFTGKLIKIGDWEKFMNSISKDGERE